MGLNRHRRGYATKEAGSTVHFPVLGPIGLARSHILISISIIINITLICITNFKTCECQKHSTSIRSIALRKAYVPIILVIRENIKGWKYQSYLMHLGIKQF